ncbi:MAG: hypothetical protein RIC55_08920 [Pirellulaceae bacterium]
MFRLLGLGLLAIAAFRLSPGKLLAQGEEGAKPAATEDAADKTDDLARQPISTANDELGDLLRKWWEEGTAAGNVGDWYDNRDRGHSDLRMGPYPQLSRIEYSKAELDRRADWAAARVVRPHVTFGNSSTSAPVTGGGSNPRHYYVAPRGLELLAAQYRGANVYIYPEHRDHDPGHNGLGDGYGDLYPINTPYLIISQGSSGSDQPFMRALPTTLAALRPEVKRQLVEKGLLAPTLQLLLRSTGRQLEHPLDYLTGRAHPTVFEGPWVDPLAMAKAAHAIRLESLPPLVKLRVVEEEETVAGRDFFDPAPGERLADTESAIGRLFRGKNRLKQMTVSAEDSLDVNDRPLAFTWVVLRGDPQSVRIAPLDDAGARARIEVAFPNRRPVAPGGIASNRVDVGVFAHNGAGFSPPAFISFYAFDSEARKYDDEGRVREIGYGMRDVHIEVKDWPGLMRLAAEDTPAARVLPLSDVARKTLAASADEYARLDKQFSNADQAQQEADKAWRDAQAALREARAELDEAKTGGDAEKQKAAGELTADRQAAVTAAGETRSAAQKARQQAEQARTGFLRQDRPQIGGSFESLVHDAIEQRLDDPQFAQKHREAMEATLGEDRAKSLLDAEWKELVDYGLGALDEKMNFTYTPLLEGQDGQPAWTDYERMLIRRANLRFLSVLLPAEMVSGRFVENYVDPRLTTPKNWRDVFHYHENGRLLGWSRYSPEGKTEFNVHGELVLERDDAGRCTKARTVDYSLELASRAPLRFKPLVQKPGSEVLTYKYDGADDFVGRVVERVKD